MRALCPRHPHKTARGRCAECGRPFCARCEFRTEGRLFCGPACGRAHQRGRGGRASGAARQPRAPLRRLGAAAAVIALAALPRRAAAPLAPSRPAVFRPAAAVPRPIEARLVTAAILPPSLRSPRPVPRPAEEKVVTPAALPSSLRPPRPVPLLPPRDLPPPDAGSKRILVSFDAGSSDRGAAEILDALRGRAIRTTIFLTGQFIRRYPDLTRRIAADGHEVGNHTWDHPHLTTYAADGRQTTLPGVREETVRDELLRTAAIYRETTGRDMAPLWRAPFGEENPEIRQWALGAGFAHVSWTHGAGGSLDSLDWVSDPESPRYRPSERVISRLLASARPDGIILMHLGSDRNDPVGGHLSRLLDGLVSEGYRFSTASELIGSGNALR